ncbi:MULTISPECIES: CPBP family intramembrane glutamic endopeptidase [Actinokineospora]|uniref:CAAX amino protease n=1 Tax=Actinokineospora fastidiosa TaxID=1816 RepID=A0A918L7L8_9PSEU|nr:MULTISPECIES: CPBP family intramembrane glutamic endopeptidase [Actinokineospora]UVS76420.1 CAAX amino terminal protease self- immunity [Actinokineospora sp. UTMC 2448]GGS18307.1 CAAX amino protease [Actinokineospora fastidiosa]
MSAPSERAVIRLELVVVFAMTLGLAGLSSLLTLIDALLAPTPISDQTIAINVPLARAGVIDFLKQLIAVIRLLAWGALGAYLLYRAGMKLAAVGLDGTRKGRDTALGVGLAALIGIPGLAFYLAAHAAGMNLAVAPSTLDDTWWRPIALVLLAVGNAWAEEVLVVGYLITRLRHLGMSETAALLVSAVVRGSYHLYQGFGGFVGNVVMGLVFGRVWQRTNRLWPLVIAHTLLDVVAFVGYALLRDRVSWLP